MRVLAVDAERNRVNLSMRPEGSEGSAKAPRQPRREAQANTEQRSERKSQAKRPQQARPQGDRPQQAKKPQSTKPQEAKIGGLGALLLQAGIKGSK